MQRNILIAEDNADLRSAITKTLRAEGYQVTTAENGEEALEILRRTQGNWSAVLTDFNMPKRNGGSLLRQILAEGFSVDILILITSLPASEPEVVSLKEDLSHRKFFHFEKPNFWQGIKALLLPDASEGR